MFKNIMIMTFVVTFFAVDCVEKIVVVKKKREKKVSKNKMKEQIVEQLDQIIDQSLELIRELTHVSGESIDHVKEIASNQDKLTSKKECQACQKRLKQYTQKMSEMIKEVRSFSTCF